MQPLERKALSGSFLLTFSGSQHVLHPCKGREPAAGAMGFSIRGTLRTAGPPRWVQCAEKFERRLPAETLFLFSAIRTFLILLFLMLFVGCTPELGEQAALG
jgi:hypothetical protein